MNNQNYVDCRCSRRTSAPAARTLDGTVDPGRRRSLGEGQGLCHEATTNLQLISEHQRWSERHSAQGQKYCCVPPTRCRKKNIKPANCPSNGHQKRQTSSLVFSELPLFLQVSSSFAGTWWACSCCSTTPSLFRQAWLGMSRWHHQHLAGYTWRSSFGLAWYFGVWISQSISTPPSTSEASCKPNASKSCDSSRIDQMWGNVLDFFWGGLEAENIRKLWLSTMSNERQVVLFHQLDAFWLGADRFWLQLRLLRLGGHESGGGAFRPHSQGPAPHSAHQTLETEFADRRKCRGRRTPMGDHGGGN